MTQHSPIVTENVLRQLQQRVSELMGHDGAYSQMKASKDVLNTILQRHLPDPLNILTPEEKAYLATASGFVPDGTQISHDIISQETLRAHSPSLSADRLRTYRSLSRERIRMLGHHGLTGEFGNGVGQIEMMAHLLGPERTESFGRALANFCTRMEQDSHFWRNRHQHEDGDLALSSGDKFSPTHLPFVRHETTFQAYERITRDISEWAASHRGALSEAELHQVAWAVDKFNDATREMKHFLEVAKLALKQRKAQELDDKLSRSH